MSIWVVIGLLSLAGVAVGLSLLAMARAGLEKFEATQKAMAAVQKMQAVCPLELGADGRPKCTEKKETVK